MTGTSTDQADLAPADFSAASDNLAFIRKQLRISLQDGDAVLLKALSDSLSNSVKSNYKRRAFLAPLQPLQDFVKPRFEQELNRQFGTLLNPLSDTCSRTHHTLKEFSYPSYRPVYRRSLSSQTLLQAALHNFNATDAVEGEGAEQSVTLLRQGKVLAGVSAAAYARFCRQLDLGGQYQKHIGALFTPDDGGAASASIRKLFTDCDRFSLQIDAHLALIHKRISRDMYTRLIDISTGKQDVSYNSLPISYRTLSLEGIKLPGIGVFEWSFTPLGALAGAQRPWVRLLVHIPNDIRFPLKEYTSWRAFEQDLIDKLADEHYRDFFLGFAHKRDQPRLLERLQQALFSVVDGQTVLRPAPELWLDSLRRPGGYFDDVFHKRLEQMKDDARFCAVPTAEQDNTARRQALEKALEIGLDVLGVASLLLPGAGELLFGVTVAQLMGEVFTGFEDWAEGDHYEAAHCLSQVAAEVAGLAAGALVISSVSILFRQSALFQRLLSVKHGNKQYLWNPDLEPYACNLRPEELGMADDKGIYPLEGQSFIEMQGRYYHVQKDAEGRYRLHHPRRDQAWQPELEHNGQGGWWAAFECPRQWPGGAALFRRAGQVAKGLDEQEIEALMAIAGRDDAHLRRLFERRRPLDGRLLDACARLRIYRRLQRFNEHLNTSARAIDPELTLALIKLMHEGRSARQIELVAARTEDARYSMQLLTSEVERDGLLETVFTALQEDERLLLMPGVQVAGRSVSQLGHSLSDWLQSNWQACFAQCLQREELLQPGLLYPYFPGLGRHWAASLEAMATAQESRSLAVERRLPLRLGEMARSALREQRIDQALEGFFWPRLANDDNHRLLLHFLSLDARWPSSLKLTIEGRGEEGVVSLHRRGNGFVDERTPTARPLDLIELALNLANLDPAEGINALRRQLGLQAAARRSVSRSVLGIKERSWWMPLQRFEDGRLGYALSGKGVLPGAAGDVNEMILALYPDFTEQDIAAFMQPYAQRPQALHALLRQQREQLQQLRHVLGRWQEQPGTLRQGVHRQAFGQRLELAWRRQGRGVLTAFGQHLGYSLSLSGLHVGELPNLTGIDFSHVVELDLSHMDLAEGVDGLLQSFPRLRMLDLSGNRLNSFPRRLVTCGFLRNLQLRNNGQLLTQADLAQLQLIESLETLDLTGTALAQAPDFTLQPHLRVVQLRNTGLEEMPSGVQNLAQLHMIDLRDNQISALPPTFLQEPADFLRSVSLDDNPLSTQDYQAFLQLQAAETLPALMATGASSNELFWLAPRSLYPQALEHWQLLERDPDCQSLLRLFERLSSSEVAHEFTEELRARVRMLLEAARGPRMARELALELANPVMRGESPLRTFIALEHRVQALQALREGIESGSATALVAFSRASFRQQRLDAFVRQQVEGSAALQQAGEDVTLAYRHALHQRLELPGARLSGPPGHLVIAEDRLALAIAHVLAGTDDAFASFLAARDYWIQYILQTRWHNLNALDALFRERLIARRLTWTDLSQSQREARELELQQQLSDAEWALLRRLTREALGLPGVEPRRDG
ncbi:dermonecrotic toxin domain-containing protein [Pseudomonas sp. NPDC090755]|uniref:dermonecrotic toxin domain-containing protein n=1 Tax=Pseudomonas sp. NPDC090755 TaxID=3364481 RepID=UPI00383AB4C3